VRPPFWRRSKRQTQLEQEIQSHLQMAASDRVERGESADSAHQAVRREFGNVALVEQVTCDQWPWRWPDEFLQDLRYAVRTMLKSPGFAIAAVLTLALGLGVNAAIFGLVDSAILRSLPFQESERLVHVWTTDAGGDLHTPFPQQYLALQKYSQAFDQVAAVGWVDNFYDTGESASQNLPGIVVSSNWLPTLGVQPLIGRNFLDEEQTVGRDMVVILSYACWRTRFHADRSILGKQIILNRRPVTVVGVLPQSLGAYYEYENIDIIAPLVLESYVSNGRARVAGAVRVRIEARLRPGITVNQARSETEAIAEGLRTQTAPADRSDHLVVEDFAEMLRHSGPTMQNARRGLWLMTGAAGVVLLIACANVASLLFARGVKRQKEVALRSALGCSRTRMIRQLLTESTLLFLCGGSLGLVMARWSEEIITKVASGIVSNTAYLELNARVLLVSLAVSLVSALFFGLIPAIHTTRMSLNDTLKHAIPNATSGSRARQPRNFLVVFQIALGMVLLVGFGLLFRSMLRVESASFGFDSHNVLTATVSLPVSRYADPSARARFLHAAAERVRAMLAVESAGITDSLPMEGADSGRIGLETPSSAATRIGEEIYFVSVSPEYFSALKIRMLDGRSFAESDSQGTKPVAIINRTFANMYFPGANPIGHRLAFADSPTNWREIVGIVSDFRQRNPEEELRPLVYLPIAQTLPSRASMAIRVRPSSDSAKMAVQISSWLQPVDPQVYWEMSSMESEIHNSESLTLRRPIITLLACFGSLALVLVVVGVFGVTSYSVAERTREIGIRIALGAPRPKIARLVLWESLGLTLAGLSLGTLGALGLTQFLPTGPIGWSGSGIFLYAVSRTDILTYSLSAVLLTSVVFVASWAPARRAMRVDPIVALRYE
jgi:putative ABC transport system permease protein